VAELVMALVGLGIGIGLILEGLPWVLGYPLAGVSALILGLLGLRTARRRGAPPPDSDS
jgi:hypothetical protein